MTKTTEIRQQLAASMPRMRSLEAVQRLVSYAEAASYALLHRRILSTIAICSIVWLATLWLAATIARAQESPSNDSVLTVTQPAIAQRSIEETEARHLVLSMVERRDLEPGALRNSAVQLTNPHPTDAQNAEKVLLPSNPKGPEFASLAALASAPPSSLLYSIQAKGSARANAGSPASDNKDFVYQFGTVNLVINGLPNRFSVSSAGKNLSGAR